MLHIGQKRTLKMPRLRATRGWFETALHFIEGAIGFGLISGAAVAAALGNLMLCAILAALSFGVFLRFNRGRTRK